MRAYHKCSLDEAAQLAAYIYRVLYGENTSYFDDRKYGRLIPTTNEYILLYIAQNKCIIYHVLFLVTDTNNTYMPHHS